MKLFLAAQIRQADAYTIENEPIQSVDLMERAANACFTKLTELYLDAKCFKIFVGTGNNGGDGLVIAHLLAEQNIQVEVFVLRLSTTASPDFDVNFNRLKTIAKVPVSELFCVEDFPQLSPSDVVIDALFGSGLTRALTGLAADLVEHINASRAEIVAVDVPSGLFGEENHTQRQVIVKAKHTITFEFPFLSFLFPENEAFVGQFHVVRIGIHPDFTSHTDTNYFLTERRDVQNMLHPRRKFSHKGTFGHTLILAGSYGKAGAQILACRAAHRAGVGLVTAAAVEKNYAVLLTASPETMVLPEINSDNLTELPILTTYSSVALGPGIGFAPETVSMLFRLLETATIPLVLDADALTILAQHPDYLHKLPPNTILTPHPKEFERLVGKTENQYTRVQVLRNFAQKFKCIVVLKGAYSAVALPDGTVHFNSTGNAGMATGGSGDVLTGIIAALLAQNYLPNQAAVLGVYLHGLAGDCAAQMLSEQALIAGDIIDFLPEAWKKVVSN